MVKSAPPVGLNGESQISVNTWQKPTVENTNGLIREFFPKGTDFSRVTDEEVQEVFEKINDRPRKVLGFRTANEVYREM